MEQVLQEKTTSPKASPKTCSEIAQNYNWFAKLDKMFGRAHLLVMTILKNHVKQHRARLDLTQEALGSSVGVRRQTILAIEKGYYIPSTLVAFKIARELGMTVDELFELAENERVQ